MHETWADKSQRMVEQALDLKMELRKKDINIKDICTIEILEVFHLEIRNRLNT